LSRRAAARGTPIAMSSRMRINCRWPVGSAGVGVAHRAMVARRTMIGPSRLGVLLVRQFGLHDWEIEEEQPTMPPPGKDRASS